MAKNISFNISRLIASKRLIVQSVKSLILYADGVVPMRCLWVESGFVSKVNQRGPY